MTVGGCKENGLDEQAGETEESVGSVGGGSAVWLERVTTGARNRQTMQQVAAKSPIKLYTL